MLSPLCFLLSVFTYDNNEVKTFRKESGIGQFRQVFNFKRFPFDKQKLKISITPEVNSNQNISQVYPNTGYAAVTFLTPERGAFLGLEEYINNISKNYLKEWTVTNTNIESEEIILDKLLPSRDDNYVQGWEDGEGKEKNKSTRQKLRKDFREGKLDDKEIDIDLPTNSNYFEIMSPPGMEEMTDQLQGMFKNFSSNKTKSQRVKIKDAAKLISEQEAKKLINEEELKSEALRLVEQNGIVFIDEIDKVAHRASSGVADVSREGVQRDLLPLVEGCTVTTKHGMIKTDHILFIASGAFHLSKPSDLIPELQGRLPIRVELKALNIDDFKRILKEPDFSITEQYRALLKTENIVINFKDSAIAKIAEIAWQVNERTENIGARRLHTIMERLLESLSFEASDLTSKTVNIDEKYVLKFLDGLTENEDLSRYIL